jgi:hypothetical protein
MIWILSISCVILAVAVIVLLVLKIDSKKAMVGAVVASLAAGAGSGSFVNSGPKFIVDNGVTTKTVYAELKDQGKERPAHDIIIKRPLETGHTMTMAVWYDTVLVVDLIYKKTTESDSDKVTNVHVGIIVDDTIGVR